MAGAGSHQRGSDRVLNKLNESIDAGNFYEAHQMYRTLNYRYLNQKKYAEACELLYAGSLQLLERGQAASGSDLALLLLDAMDKSQQIIAEGDIERLRSLHALIPDTVPERETFVVKAVDLARKSDEQAGMHQAFASNFWKEKNLSLARQHFLYSNDGESCGKLLVEYHMQNGYLSEVDLFVTQAVLQYLCLRNRGAAVVTFFTYTRKHPSIQDGPPFILPLLNFVWFLLLAVNEGKLTVFTILCEKYETSLSRDPTYKQYLDKIGQLFFGLPPPARSSGFFGGLVQSLLGGSLGGLDSSDDEDTSSDGNFASSPRRPPAASVPDLD